jgi:hypothetical protein
MKNAVAYYNAAEFVGLAPGLVFICASLQLRFSFQWQERALIFAACANSLCDSQIFRLLVYQTVVVRMVHNGETKLKRERVGLFLAVNRVTRWG